MSDELAPGDLVTITNGPYRWYAVPCLKILATQLLSATENPTLSDYWNVAYSRVMGELPADQLVVFLSQEKTRDVVYLLILDPEHGRVVGRAITSANVRIQKVGV